MTDRELAGGVIELEIPARAEFVALARLGWPTPAASRVMLIELVLLAKMASASADAVSARHVSRFTASSSKTASTMMARTVVATIDSRMAPLTRRTYSAIRISSPISSW